MRERERAQSTDEDFELDFDDGGDDGEQGVVGGAWTQLPALERHVDVLVLHERQRAEETRLE